MWARKAIFQIHLWSGIGIGLYIVVICVTGSVLVYRNELYRAATPKPIVAVGSGPTLTDAALKVAVLRAYPGYKVTNIFRARNPSQAVDVRLLRDRTEKKRLVDPYTGRDLGHAVPPGIIVMSTLLDLHDNLLGGTTGRAVNGVGALLFVLMGLTGVVIWWPGVQSWRRSLMVHRKVGWKRFTWDLHSAIGLWSLAFVLLFGITGAHLSFPEWTFAIVNVFEPETETNFGLRAGDRAIYWLTYLHFGRIGGWKTKIPWVLFGLAPAFLAVTGGIMWWNRVLRRAIRQPADEAARQAVAATGG